MENQHRWQPHKDVFHSKQSLDNSGNRSLFAGSFEDSFFIIKTNNMHLLDPGAKSADTAEETTGTENAGTDTPAASGDGEATSQEEA